MVLVNAAVVTSFDEPPHHQPFELPAVGGGQEVVEVLAVGLHPRTRSGASGTHYTSTGVLPMVPGIDGVGRRADGTLVYFAADDDTIGTLAARTVIDSRRSVALPPDADVVAIAAAMNPAMSSWVALRTRVPIEPGQSVLVLGATGNAGSMAVEVAKLLGAGRVVGAGRDRARLDALGDRGVDDIVALTDDREATARALADAAADVDIVLDFVWGRPAADAMVALVTARSDRGREMNWIEIGSTAGPTLELPSAVLRSANFRLQGSGQGSVTPRGYLAELPALVDEIDAGRIGVQTRTVPLADVERIWAEPDVPGVRTVLVP
ncbi:quinone oxidoreductase family protein [Gordonia hankookensis]|uniref:Zinc-binding alcohol dehydrogenase family protein n=1 Tax=Gordonia hankookensis TaxID=589403 RepID=A0ABR7WA98_9ACTN|nr:zinc-binding alcohol dehydrogenase family protein [Gordonia hankookensis]MBD1319198.1 zinc-binding alcohol dehydrogenase family protein [Gordonia hankookensis]